MRSGTRDGRTLHRCLPILGILAAACAGPGAPSSGDAAPADGPTVADLPVLGISFPVPLIPGSPIRLRVPGLSLLGEPLRLDLTGTSTSLPAVPAGDREAVARVPRSLVDSLGPRWDGEVRLSGPAGATEPVAVSWELAPGLTPTLAAWGASLVHLEDLVPVHGLGILVPGEGENRLAFQGTWTPRDGGGPEPVSTEVPLVPAEEPARDRGLVRFPLLGSQAGPGRWEGSLVLRTRMEAGEWQSSAPLAAALAVADPEVSSLTPTEGRLGQVITVTGAGWLGATEGWPPGLEAGGVPGATTFRLTGRWIPDSGEGEAPVDLRLVPALSGGGRALLVVRATARQDRLVSEWFRTRSGRFEGNLEAEVLPEGSRVPWRSGTLPLSWPIRTTGQVVVVRFLPGFDESLDRFGLASLGREVRQAVLQTIDGIYGDYDLEVRETDPEDLDPNHWSLLEIGGPDPNGRGLMGLDNTPGKDVGNLRLFDRLGGLNAEVQSDGYPGYGGVFLESFLQWSAHPPQGREALPSGAPEAAAAFDAVFDPVRQTPALREEFLGQGTPGRVQAVREAVRVLGRLVGETAAHEVGHSLGLADPYGPPTRYHNATDEPGCLMDVGNARPFEERAALPGAAPTRFCHDHPAYLLDILGPRRAPNEPPGTDSRSPSAGGRHWSPPGDREARRLGPTSPCTTAGALLG